MMAMRLGRGFFNRGIEWLTYRGLVWNMNFTSQTFSRSNSLENHATISIVGHWQMLRRYSVFPAEGAELIIAKGWQVTEENASDWHGHAAAVAHSIQLIKGRMQWKEVLSRLRELETELQQPDLWQDPERASKCSREKGAITARMKAVKDMEDELVEHVGLAELAREENDLQVEAETVVALRNLRKHANELELTALLSGKDDAASCFLEVQAGAGGTESMDWASMVIRMYTQWAIRRGFEVSLIDEMPGEEAGIKRATIRLDGDYAYGYAKTEAGVHRLVRMSPFDSNKRRHTSFAAVAVIPIEEESADKMVINEADLVIERFKAGGPGGQHANKTESAIRILHKPTGITAQCHSQRSQHQNKEAALQVLKSRIRQVRVTQQAEATAHHTQSLSEISWGNHIRSYVLQPYQMVKDMRTGYEVSDPYSVLAGDLDSFIMKFLASTASNQAS